ncbi:LysR substrate-binding domain-containing protein [Shimia sp. SDUM112013]|uniref:LysR substrate-binding domain-containing protein n=1 Tax=Shimia sp. SDUM112013 TaxID=3136160 RepID=UPI0032EB93E1
MSDGRLPNLNGLRVLVEVDQHRSFTRAAEALGVTQSAVSKQIAALEAHFGQPLFSRAHRKVEITPFGKKVAEIAATAFDQIQSGLRNDREAAPDQVSLWGDADFVELWLFPRLQRFEALHPDIRISISVGVGMNQPPIAPYDCAIIWGRGGWTNCRFEPLMTNSVFPVAAPGFFRHLDRPPELSDIPEHQLIHDQGAFWWRAFREAAGDRSFNPNAGRIYNRSALCLEAAARGNGITIGDEVTTREHIERGTLVCPFNTRLPSPDSYFVILPENVNKTEAVSRFILWLKGECDEHNRFFGSFWKTRA